MNIQGNPTAGEIARNKFSPVILQKIEMQTEDLEIDLFCGNSDGSGAPRLFQSRSHTVILAAFPCVALKSEMGRRSVIQDPQGVAASIITYLNK